MDGLKIATKVYEIAAGDTRKLVLSAAFLTGGGGGGFRPDPPPEFVNFYIQIILDPAERDEEAHKYVAWLEKGMEPEKISDAQRKTALNNVREFIHQHRVGHIEIEFDVMDGQRVQGVGTLQIEVLFKGRFSDKYPPIPKEKHG